MNREDAHCLAGKALRYTVIFQCIVFAVAVLTGEPNTSIGTVERAGRVAGVLLISAAVYAYGSKLIAMGDDIKLAKELEKSDRIDKRGG